MKQIIAIVAIASAMLSACGGGSSSNGVNISSEADPTDKYVGTWKGPCYSSTAVTQKADGKSTNIITALKISKLTSSTANAEINLTVYSNGDTTCSGTAIGSIVKTGRNENSFSSDAKGMVSSYGQNLFTYNASVTLASGKTVDQVIFSESKLSAISSYALTVGNLIVNSVSYGAASYKAILYFRDAKTLIFTPSAQFNTIAYPTEVLEYEGLTFVKQ
jgi:hypothetical protein